VEEAGHGEKDSTPLQGECNSNPVDENRTRNETKTFETRRKEETEDLKRSGHRVIDYRVIGKKRAGFWFALILRASASPW
jgi:hypothetical protein